MPLERPLPHNTVATEDWNCADDLTGINCDLTWDEVVDDWNILSNEVRTDSNTVAIARADTDVSTADMTSEVDITAVEVQRQAAPSARFDPSADTAYLYIVKQLGSDTHRLYKRITGSFTQLGARINETAPTVPYRIGTRIEGSTLNGFLNGSLHIGPRTDTQITGHTRGGLYAHRTTHRLDNWQLADLEVPFDTDRRRPTIISELFQDQLEEILVRVFFVVDLVWGFN